MKLKIAIKLIDKLKIFILLHLSPCVVGNLWDVTDIDIDRLTDDLLRSWLNTPDQNQTTNNICVHLNKARSTCKMSHLNGSAPVIYGLPVYFK